ncbi:MAG: hypothetical protein GY711_01750 [bacterium]|nr:hypothetical protein [bacterium]
MLRLEPRRFRRSRILVFRCCEWVARLLQGRRLYRRRSLDRIVVRSEEIVVEGLPDALDGFTVAHLSDIHAGPFLGRGDLRPVVEAVNAAGVDAVAFTGDFITHDWRDALTVLDEFADLRSRHGTFAVFGNHDYRGREEGRIALAFGDRGVRFLRNERVVLPVGIAIAGVEDLEEGREIELPAPGDVPEILLCHNPGGAARLVSGARPLVLAGHTHGGQIDLPVLRRLGPHHPGLRVDFGPTTLVVSRGLGVVGVPLRYRAPAEVVLVRLVASR